jgi:hypothetical protein
MSTALLPTLAEIRSSALDRCGLATEGNVPRNIQRILDEKIRSAQLQLYRLYPWLVNYVQREIPLITGTTQYDVPDDTETGNITFLCVRRLQDGWLFQMDAGIRPAEMNYVSQTPVAGAMPLRYDFREQAIIIAPTPDTTYYDALIANYYQTPGAFVEDSERAVVDGEALKMLSEILIKEHFGGMETDRLRADLGLYIDRVKVTQSNGEGFQMGGHQSLIGKTQPRNRFAWSSIRGNTWRDWRPW